MCGIAGQFRVKPESIICEEDVQKMLDIIIHRGPDGEGKYISNNCSFGMRRLSIIDLEGGWQPLYNEDRSVVCVCNGEIYNYIELKNELIRMGHSFITKSDIEVIPHLFEQYGESFVNKLNGMFSIALLNIKKGVLYLYRDRLGKKPLYYSEQNGKLFFASEIKSIIVCKDVKRTCNYKALDYILTYNYIPNNMTSFEGIYKVMPGEYLEVSQDRIQRHIYWELKVKTDSSGVRNEKLASSEIAELLEDSVRIRLRSDVPVGAFLSGGVDSSMVVSVASMLAKSINTFSIGFNESDYDESMYAREVATLYGTNHHQQMVDEHFFELLPKTIWLCDDPHGDVSFLPSFVLAKNTSKVVKTVLTGDGGDELFGGYDKYLAFNNDENKSMVSFFEKNSVFSKIQKNELYTKKMNAMVGEQNCLDYIKTLLSEKGLDDENNSVDRLNVLLYLETKLLLEGNNLVKPDRMGMGCSLEARMPLMDYRLVEYVSSLPSSLKIQNGITKYIFKKIAETRLPKDIVYRKKQMFTVPIGEWFKESLKQTAYEILLAKRTIERGLFRKEVVQRMFFDHVQGKQNYTRQLRLLIIIELWHRIFIDEMSDKPSKLSELL